MAKKELTEEELFKKDYSSLVKLNQKLKNVSSAYYISHDGFVYMKSLVPFVEKVIQLHEPQKYFRFAGTMIMPNAFFEFTKKAKKTKLTVTQTENCIYLGQDDNEEVQCKINIVNTNNGIDKQYVLTNIQPKMYKRYFKLNEDNIIQYEDSNTEHPLTESEIESLCKANPIFLEFNGTTLTITKQLFLDIKKDDCISISRSHYQKIEDGKLRVFYILKHITDLYTCYTLFNTLQS